MIRKASRAERQKEKKGPYAYNGLILAEFDISQNHFHSVYTVVLLLSIPDDFIKLSCKLPFIINIYY